MPDDAYLPSDLTPAELSANSANSLTMDTYAREPSVIETVRSSGRPARKAARHHDLPVRRREPSHLPVPSQVLSRCMRQDYCPDVCR